MSLTLIRQLEAFFGDNLLILFFLHPLPSKAYNPIWRNCLICFALIGVIPIYLHPSILGTLFYFAIRLLCTMLYLKVSKNLSWQGGLFYALFYVVCYTTIQNIFLVPFLSSVYIGEIPFTANPLLNTVLCSIIRVMIFGVLFMLIHLCLPLDGTVSFDLLQFAVFSPLICCALYVKQTLSGISASKDFQINVVSSYPILLQVLLLSFVVLFERYLFITKQQEELRIQAITNSYCLRVLEARQSGEADIRAIHHDMKNHLLTIRELSHKCELGRINTYIAELLADFSSYEVLIKTGNTLLDGLLSTKVAEARKNNIDINIAVDFRQIDYLRDSDLCTIFGNILDNAMEACLKIDDPNKRFIQVRTRYAGDYMVFILQNSFTGGLKFFNDLPLTTKSSKYHGIGLRNVHRAVSLYNGTIDIKIEEGNIFIVSIMLPTKEISFTSI